MKGKRQMLLSICMIVKDEEANLPRALSSVKGVADEVIVVDTGSQDRTVETARRFGARVTHFPWTADFSAARNSGLELARGRWVMVLDADEELKAEDRVRVRPMLQAAKADAYVCPVISLLGAAGRHDFEHSTLLRFWRNDPAHRYTGLMHEDISPSIFTRNPQARLDAAQIRFVHYGYLDEAEAAKSKKERNLALIEAQVARNPDSPFYRFNLGVEYQRHHRFSEALAQYQAIREAAPGTPWEPKWIKNLVYSLLSLGQWDEAEVELGPAIERFSDFTDLLYLRGVVEVERRDFAHAVGTFSQCAAQGPAPVPPYASAEEGLGRWKAHFALGQAYQAAGRLQEAVAAYEQARELHPDWLAPIQAIARVLLGAGVEPGKVRQYLEGQLPKGQASRLMIAELLLQGGAPGAALEAIPPEEATPAAECLRGHCLLKLGQWPDAMERFARVPGGDPLHASAVAGLAFCYWYEGREHEAQAALNELEGNEAARRQAAQLFVDAAKAALAAGLARHPDSSPLRELLERLGREIG